MTSPKRLAIIAALALAPAGLALPAAADVSGNVERHVVHADNATLRAARVTLPNGETITRTRVHGTTAAGATVNARRVVGPDGGVRARRAVSGDEHRRVTNRAYRDGEGVSRTRIIRR